MHRAFRFPFTICLSAALALAAPLRALQKAPDSTSGEPVRLRFDDGGKYGYLDATGKVVIPLQFVNALDYFSEGFARVQIGRDRSAKWSFVHTSGRVLGARLFDEVGDFSEGLAPVLVGTKWGVIDTSGAFVLEPQFARIVRFSQNRAEVKVDGQSGYIDTRGTVVIPVRFARGSAFSHGLAAVNVGRHWGLIDTTGRVVVEPRFDALSAVSPDRYAVLIGRKWQLMDRAGRTIGPAQFDDIEPFSDGLAPVKQGGKVGYIDTTGALVIPYEFDYADRFSSGRARVRRDVWTRESPPNFSGFIDRRGRIVARFLDAERFSEGLAAVVIGGKRGYVDTTGTVVIAPQFETATSFSQGAAAVTFPNNEFAYIDRAGRVIWKPASVAGAAGAAKPVVAAASLDTSALAGTGPLVARLARLVERLEGAERSGELGVVAFGATPLLPQIVGADQRVRAHADSHPDDARLAILAARLGRVKWVAEPVVFPAENRPSLDAHTKAFAPYQEYLRRVLALDPNNAQAHYWMGRLYGMSMSWKRLLYGFSETPDTAAVFFRTRADSALHHARRAMELAPDHVPYREALALYLVMVDRPDEAAEVVRDVAGGRHPISVLISDWRMFPTPPGAVPDPQQTGLLASRQQGQDHAELRVRAYVLPTSAADAEAFYRARWPNLQLFDAKDKDLQAAGARVFMQFLRLKGTNLEPARTRKELERISEKPPDGFVLIVSEITNPDDNVRSRLPVAVGDTFCVLSVINTRRLRR